MGRTGNRARDGRRGAAEGVRVTGRRGTGLVVSVPHHGAWVPDHIVEQLGVSVRRALPGLDEFSLDLSRAAEAWGAVVVNAVSRLAIDVNRSGSVSRIDLGDEPDHEQDRLVRLYTPDGLPLWRRRVGQPYMTRGELEDRLGRYHEPYHRALAEALEEAPATRVLVDLHSVSWPAFDAVLGDFRGRSAGSALCEGRLVPFLRERGLAVGYAGPRDVDPTGRPVPYDAVRYSGGFITARYGDPAGGQYAIQLEVSRQACSHRFEAMRTALGEFFQFLAQQIAASPNLPA